MELVSFVIPSHNCVTYLPAAVDSVRAQTHRELEIIVVNDGSTDRTSQYLDWLVKNEPRARVINNSFALGRSVSRNMGNQSAKGEYIFVLDADDMSHDRRVEFCLPKLRKFQFVHGLAESIDCFGTRLGMLPTDVFSMEKTLKDPALQTTIVHSSVAYSREFASKYPYGTGDMSSLGLDDWAQQISAARDGVKFEYVNHLLCHYRHLPTAISKTRKQDEVMSAKREFLGLVEAK